MRSKRTIRRMKGTPQARKLAHLAIEARSIAKRLDYLVAEVQEVELTAAVYERALREHGWDTGTMGAEVATQLRLASMGPELDEIDSELGGGAEGGQVDPRD